MSGLDQQVRYENTSDFPPLNEPLATLENYFRKTTGVTSGKENTVEDRMDQMRPGIQKTQPCFH